MRKYKNWQFHYIYYKHPDLRPDNPNRREVGIAIRQEDFTTPEALAFKAHWEALQQTLKNQVIYVFNDMKG